ncbi:MAG: hypothetical protein ACOY4A_11515 [Pseudomonadota bacterium]
MAAPATPAIRQSRGLLALTVALAALAPVALWLGRLPGLGTHDYLIYYRLLFYNDVANGLAMLAALLAALLIPGLRRTATRLADALSRHPVAGSMLAFVGLALFARIVYQGFPLATDEYAPVLQARIFANGELAIRYPPALLDRIVPRSFQGWFILVNPTTGQAASAYWPGLALLMTPLALFGGEWLLNPLFGALGLWLLGDLAVQASRQPQARGWAMLAALASPQYTVNALSYYAMPGLLTLNLLFLWLVLRPSHKSAALAGAVGSLALVLHNPLPHALFALPVLLWLTWDPQRRRRLPALVLGYLPLLLVLLLGWLLATDAMGLRQAPTGAQHLTLIGAWTRKLAGLFVLPTPALLTVRAYALWKTLIWTAPGLVLLACVQRPASAIERLLLAAFVLMFAFYFFIPFDQGHGWGYRYLHPAWGLIPVATAVAATRAMPGKIALPALALAAGLLATPVFLWTTRATISEAIAMQPPVSGDAMSYVFVADRPNLYTMDLVRNYPADRGYVLRMVGTDFAADRALVRKLAPNARLLHADERGATWSAPIVRDSPSHAD